MFLWIKTLRQYYLFSFLTAIFLCSACVSENQKLSTGLTDNRSLSILPSELQKEHISLNEFLNAYDNLDNRQRALALGHILTQANLSSKEESEAAYILGRILQQLIEKQDNQASIKENCKESLALFNQAKTYPPLRTNALWHISEVATIYGDEKVVRQALNELLSNASDANTSAAAQYALAQSYLRASEIDKATVAFKKIGTDFPETNYALGSAYYLGTLAYTQFEKEYKLRSSQLQKCVNTMNLRSQLKTVLSFYLEYLQKSPSGRFAADILAKLEILNKPDNHLFKPEELAVIANAYFLGRQYNIALNYWQRAGIDKYPFEIADCLIKLGQFPAAQKELFKAVDKYHTDRRYLLIAKAVSMRLNKQDNFSLWEKLHKSSLCGQDEVLWNLATRASTPKALSYYQQIVTYYPTSSYAPEAQWRIFWQRIKQSNDKSLAAVGTWCYAAAHKYNHSKLAPRFMFWAGKISEIFNKQQAEIYYLQTQDLYKTDYYGQRAKARYAHLKNNRRDNYFELQFPVSNVAQHWDWPMPQKIIESKAIQEKNTLSELVYLKQYDEVLAQNPDLPVEMISWLKGKTKQPLEAINTAAKCLQENNSKKDFTEISYGNLLWQCSYPLLYDREIMTYCRTAGILDPLFLHALIREESRYEVHAVSSVNALGLCQLMPATAIGIAKNQGINMIDSSQLYDPDLNIKLGSLYLSSVLKTFDGNGLYAIASYNAGSGAVKAQLKNKQNLLVGDPDYFVEDFPYKETRDYIRKVFNSYYRYREIYH